MKLVKNWQNLVKKVWNKVILILKWTKNLVKKGPKCPKFSQKYKLFLVLTCSSSCCAILVGHLSKILPILVSVIPIPISILRIIFDNHCLGLIFDLSAVVCYQLNLNWRLNDLQRATGDFVSFWYRRWRRRFLTQNCGATKFPGGARWRF